MEMIDLAVRILSVNLLGNCNSFFKTYTYEIISSLSPGAPIIFVLISCTFHLTSFFKYSYRNFNNLSVLCMAYRGLLIYAKLCLSCLCRLYVTCPYIHFSIIQNKFNQYVYSIGGSSGQAVNRH